MNISIDNTRDSNISKATKNFIADSINKLRKTPSQMKKSKLLKSFKIPELDFSEVLYLNGSFHNYVN